MRYAVGLLLVLACSGALAGQPTQRTLTFEDRVKAQAAIEQVYWNHRIWPKDNPGPKPPLSAVMPDSAIRTRVEDYLRMSALLDSSWHRSLTGDQLQAEIERMVRQTKAPKTLRELFAALDDDPFLIAECLARPTLIQHLVESAFGGDERIHGAQRAALASKLAGVRNVAGLERIDGDHAEITFVVDDGAAADSPPADPSDRAVHLTREEWNREVERLEASFEFAPEPGTGFLLAAASLHASKDSLSRLPLGRVSRLLDRDDHFVAVAVRAKSPTSVTVVSVSWTKRSYEEWAREAVGSSSLDSSPIVPPVQGYAEPALPLVGCTDDTWTSTSPDEPEPRWGHTAVWTGTEMIVWGGNNSSAGGGGSTFATGGRYNPSTDSWTTSSLITGSGANVPIARTGHRAVWTGTEMIVWGGYSYGYGYLNTGGRYNPAADSWAASSLTTGSGASVPTGCSSHTAVWTGTEMIVWGGTNGVVPHVNTGGRYNPSNDTWTPTSTGTNVPIPLVGHTAVWTGTEMIVWGGQNSPNSGQFVNIGGRYRPATDTWVASSLTTGSGANVPTARIQHSAVWTGTEMIVWGGFYDATVISLQTGGRYNPTSDSWAASSLMTGSGANVPTARNVHTAIWTGTEMIVWGGYGSVGTALNTGGRYNPSTDSWVASSLTTGSGTNVAFPRTSHTAVWTGTEMIVWGGDSSGTSWATGGRYNPSTDSWMASSLTTGAARYGHTAVWTGAEMIVWGGNGSVVLKTGGRYNPATDSWAASSLTLGSGANVPTARYWHKAIWTGTEMIVWGGYNNQVGVLKTGGRYSPATDSWAASSLTTGSGANVPSARYLHSAIWTGTEMIVWGGYNFSATLQTGGRYSPSTDTWTSTSTGANVPTASQYHTAIWTGSEMIVWGGYNGSVSLQTGGRYNPSTDLWTASSLTTGSGVNVSGVRRVHTAVWTGTEMIVWGGYNGSVSLQTGGRYNPTSDTWASSSLTAGTGANVPTARAWHTAIWTGSEMIVWGGSGIGYLNTGGRYSPATDSWAASSLNSGSGANVPGACAYHTAVWTGSEMIIWGGDHGGASDSGGIYCAQTCSPQTWYQDADADGHGNTSVTQSSCTQPTGYAAVGGDCNDASATVWGRPDEVRTLTFAADKRTLNWLAPASLGGTSVTFDALRSGTPNDFQAGATCVATGIGAATATDVNIPTVGLRFCYLVRANNACANGRGPLGFASSGAEVSGRVCP